MRTGVGAFGSLATAVGVAAVSLVVALAGGLVSRSAWRASGHLVPWGLLLAVTSSAAVVVLARTLSRAQGFAAAAGWLLGLAVLLAGRPEGDYIVAGDPLGMAFLVLGAASVCVPAAWRERPRS